MTHESRQASNGTPAESELRIAQAIALSRQVPFLYSILIINTSFVSLSHFPVVPLYLSTYFPGTLILCCAIRLLSWSRRRGEIPDAQTARKHIHLMGVLAFGLSIGFSLWCIALYQYGTMATRTHVLFYLGFTCIGCLLCLLQAPAAVLAVVAASVPPMMLLLLWSGNMVLALVAGNYVLVLSTIIFVMRRHSQDFVSLVESKAALVAHQAELLALSDENLRLANLDSLTGLANRRMFFSSLKHAAFAEDPQAFVVGILDLDGFKGVNDAYGHGVGDQLLVRVVERLHSACAGSFTVHRLGGDEFALLATRSMDEAEIHAAGNAICDALIPPQQIGDITVQVSGTLGFSRFPETATDPQELFNQAHYALYHAKKNGRRGQSMVFSNEHMSAIRREGMIVEVLKTSDLEKELYLVFQPIVDCRSESVRAFEALARWNSERLGAVSPGVFIPVAERIGMVGQLTRILLRKACAALASWPCSVRLSFNLSAHDIGCPDAIAALVRVVRDSGVDPRRIDFEITETAIMEDWEQALDSLHVLIELGVGIALDDFGSGYSSLSHLHRMPLHKIKIDRGLVTGIDANPASHRIVQSVILLSRDLGLLSVVEGVETSDERRVVGELGADMIQGFYYEGPFTAAEINDFLIAPPAPRIALAG